MNSIVRFFALSLFVALAISAATGTFDSYTTNNSTAANAAVYTNGYVVTITGATAAAPVWIYGDAITLSSTTPSVTYSTLTSFTGLTGIGLVATGCTASKITTSTTTLVGLATSNNCPADFATLYTAAPASPSPTSTTTTPTPGASIAAAGQVKWTLTGPTSTAFAIGITTSINGAAAVTTSTAAATTTGSGTTAQQFAVGSLNYAFYVQSATAAVVCFQTEAQKTSSSGLCGTIVTTTKSAGIFSAAITGFVAMIALIFFN